MPQLALATRQALRVTPVMLNLARLLQLPGLDLEQAIQEELVANPALEELPTAAPASAPPASDHHERLLLVAAPRSPVEHLLEDLCASLPTSEHGIARMLIGSLDEHGFLREPPATLARMLAVKLQRVRAVLHLLREIGPPGIAASDLRECLLLQIECLEKTGAAHPYAHAIVTTYLEELGTGRYRAIAQALHLPVAEVIAAHAFIREQLWPFPLPAVATATSREPDLRCYRTPDMAFVSHGSSITVELTASTHHNLRINPTYLELAAGAGTLDAAERAHVQEYVERAQGFLHSLQRRKRTLQRVGEALIVRQAAFLRHGIAHLVPLTRLQIAHDTGMHESTVCRAVAGKHARLLDGTLCALDDFFAAAHPVQEILRELITQEQQPLSDSQLTELLAARGYPIARRTVAKYREQLGIPAHRVRNTGVNDRNGLSELNQRPYQQSQTG